MKRHLLVFLGALTVGLVLGTSILPKIEIPPVPERRNVAPTEAFTVTTTPPPAPSPSSPPPPVVPSLDERPSDDQLAELRTWAAADFPAALAWVDQISPFRGEHGSLLLEAVLDGGAEGDPDAVFAVIRERATNFGLNLCPQWLQRHPEEAITRFSEMPVTKGTISAIASAYRSWADHAPEAAMKNYFSAEFDHPRLRQEAASGIAFSLARQSPVAALGFLSQTGVPHLIGEVGEDIAPYAFEADPVVTLEWMEKNLRSHFLTIATSNVLSTISKKTPQEAAELVSLLAPSYAETSARGLIGTWSQTDPAAAAAWANALPPGRLRDAALAELPTLEKP
ncbi:hypothetical protein BH23VER1_BH23VER1_14620 [soil metagenome]